MSKEREKVKCKTKLEFITEVAQNEKDAKKRICYGNMCRIIESVKSQYRTGSGC